MFFERPIVERGLYPRPTTRCVSRECNPLWTWVPVHFFNHEKTNQKSDPTTLKLRKGRPPWNSAFALVFSWDNSNGPFSYKIDLLEITGIELSLSASTIAPNSLWRRVESQHLLYCFKKGVWGNRGRKVI